jgi:hypothetical protein
VTARGICVLDPAGGLAFGPGRNVPALTEPWVGGSVDGQVLVAIANAQQLQVVLPVKGDGVVGPSPRVNAAGMDLESHVARSRWRDARGASS